MAKTDHAKDVADALNEHGTERQAAAAMGKGRKFVRYWKAQAREQGLLDESPGRPSWKETKARDSWVIESVDSRIRTAEDAVAKAGVDLAVWEVERVVVNGWDSTMKIKRDGEETPLRTQNTQVKVWLRRKVPVDTENAVERMLEQLAGKFPKIKRRKYDKPKKKRRHALELCIMDPHYGLRCFKPMAGGDWSPEIAAGVMLDVVDEMLRMAEVYAPFERIAFPLGNDFFHVDNVFHTTTKGTPQPEADSVLHTAIGGETLAIEIVSKLSEVAPVDVLMVPGNHARLGEFFLGRILHHRFAGDANVTVHADPVPYRKWRYGCNLIAFEHGHSVKPGLRLAGLMANEWPDDWAATKSGYREWHLGDQHRKASGSPVAFEEQGVGVEYLPGLTPPNEWSKINGYNHQTRAAMGFVWHHDHGPAARLHVNMDRHSNGLMGRATATGGTR